MRFWNDTGLTRHVRWYEIKNNMTNSRKPNRARGPALERRSRLYYGFTPIFVRYRRYSSYIQFVSPVFVTRFGSFVRFTSNACVLRGWPVRDLDSQGFLKKKKKWNVIKTIIIVFVGRYTIYFAFRSRLCTRRCLVVFIALVGAIHERLGLGVLVFCACFSFVSFLLLTPRYYSAP